MTTSSTSYKNKRSARRMQEQTQYQLGCYYTNQEMPAGYAKMLLNYDYTDDGKILKPRQGIQGDTMLYHSEINQDSVETVTLGEAHIDGLLYFKDTKNEDQLAETILSFGNVYGYSNSSAKIEQGRYFNPSINKAVDGGVLQGSSGWGVLLDKRNANAFADSPYQIVRYSTDASKNSSVGYIRAKTFDNIDIFGAGLSGLQITRPVACTFNGILYTISTSYVQENADGTVTCTDPRFRLSRLKIHEETMSDSSTFVVQREPVTIKEPVISEAMSVGFNLLLDEPYEFNNTVGGLDAKGVFAYEINDSTSDPLGEILFTANQGEKIRFCCIYSYETGKDYQVRWEYKSESDEFWTVIKDWSAAPEVKAGGTLYYDYTPSNIKFSIQCKIRVGTDDATMRVAVLPNFELNVDSLKNLGAEKVDLTTATGMFTFNGMLGLYGVKGAETTIFFSDIENPGYFPFPHNIEGYDEYVLKVINYLDILLVVTTTSIYTISGSGLPKNFVSKKLITNLNITELDAELIKVIKDQIFFKADNTYFVLKPNTYTGDATDLRAHEVSKSINTFIQNFVPNTLALFNNVYPLSKTEPDLINRPQDTNYWKYDSLDILGYNQHVVDGKLQIVVHLRLRCQDTPHQELQRIYTNEADLVIIYDTLTKQWYFQVQSLLNTSAIRHRRIDNQELLLFDQALIDNSTFVVVAKYSNTPEDNYALSYGDVKLIKEAKLPNWQYLNTGIMLMHNQLYKRLRELQFTINNVNQQTIKFVTRVYADDTNVLDNVVYQMEHNENSQSYDYGHIYINTYERTNLDFMGSTALDEWILDFSKFPDTTLLRTHLLLTGKGRFISGEFINRDIKSYELSDIIWVYRLMHGR